MGVAVPRPVNMTRASLGLEPAIMIVDDDGGLLNALVFGIEVEGYRVLAFSSAESVLDLQYIPDVACVVVDHRLPRMDGIYLVEMMRTRGLTAPAILMTSHPGPTLRARCNSLRIPIVEKPLLRDELSMAIRAAIGA